MVHNNHRYISPKCLSCASNCLEAWIHKPQEQRYAHARTCTRTGTHTHTRLKKGKQIKVLSGGLLLATWDLAYILPCFLPFFSPCWFFFPLYFQEDNRVVSEQKFLGGKREEKSGIIKTYLNFYQVLKELKDAGHDWEVFHIFKKTSLQKDSFCVYLCVPPFCSSSNTALVNHLFFKDLSAFSLILCRWYNAMCNGFVWVLLLS